jgi:hypothetical protein
MKKSLLLVTLLLFVFACKKNKEKDPPPQTEPEKTSSLTVQVIRYDSLGDAVPDRSGVSVSLPGTSFSAVTPSSGVVTFNGVPAKIHVPVIFLAGNDAGPFSVDLSAVTPYTAPDVPVAQLSPFRVSSSSFNGQKVNPDSITVSFTLEKQIPSGKSIKLAVLTGTSSNIMGTNYLSADIVPLSTSSVVKMNIAKLPDFYSKINNLGFNTNFYVKVTTASYGLFESNIYTNKILLGDCEPYSPALMFQKTW